MNLIYLTEGRIEAAIEHAERGECTEMGLKLGDAWRMLAKTGGMDPAHVDALYGRLVEAIGSRGAA